MSKNGLKPLQIQETRSGKIRSARKPELAPLLGYGYSPLRKFLKQPPKITSIIELPSEVNGGGGVGKISSKSGAEAPTPPEKLDCHKKTRNRHQTSSANLIQSTWTH